MRDYCDLNVTEKPNYMDNLCNVKQLLMLGYHTIALNREYVLPSKEQSKKGKGMASNKEHNQQTQQYVASMKTLHERIKRDLEALKKTASKDGVEIPNNFKLLSRLTFIMTEAEQIVQFRTPNIKMLVDSFDLIAISPKNEKVFTSLMSGKTDFDVVVFPMEHRPDFKVSRQMLGVGMRKGIVLEVSYSSAIRSLSLRRYIFMNAQHLVSITKRGKGVIISSGGGDSVMDFRSPQDVANLSNLFGLSGSACLDAVSTTAMKCVDHATIRRDTFKGAVKIEQVKDDDNDVCGPVMKRQKLSND